MKRMFFYILRALPGCPSPHQGAVSAIKVDKANGGLSDAFDWHCQEEIGCQFDNMEMDRFMFIFVKKKGITSI